MLNQSTRRLSALLAVVSALAFYSAPARAQVGKAGASHDHSTQARGGATLAPTRLSMLASSTATFNGAVVGVSTSGAVSDYSLSVTRTNFGVCDSTISFTMTSCVSAVNIRFNENFSSANGGQTACNNVLLNAAFVSPWSAVKAMVCERAHDVSDNVSGNIKAPVRVPGASIPCSGVVAFCVSHRASAGTLTFPSSYIGEDANNQWSVEVVK